MGCWMVKLVDVPEMGYFAKDNKGEVSSAFSCSIWTSYNSGSFQICAKGPSRFLGYLKDPEKTAEVVDKDGWLHTGDVSSKA